MTKRSGCPSPAELERAYWERDDAVRAHAEGCAACALQWCEIGELVALGAEVQVPEAPHHTREELRTELLSASRQQQAAPRWPWFAPVTAAAAVAAALIVWWAWPSAPPAADAPDHRARVLAHAGASYLEAGALPDEILRLTDGTITVGVSPLREGERFRVVTGDAEVEVRGTVFDVTAEDDRLVAVRVIHGIVEVRAGAETVTLRAGERWSQPVEVAAADEPAPVPDDAPAVAEVEPERPEPVRRPAPRRRDRAIGPPRPEPAVQPDPEPAPDAAIESPVRNAARRAFDEAWTRMRDGEFDDAADAFERVLLFADDPRFAEDASYWRGVALARANRSKPARRAFEAFLDRYPESPRAAEVSAMHGWLLFEAGLYDAAETMFRRAADDDVERVRASAEQGLRAVAGAQR